jgi:hypothetical protein
VLAGFSNIKFAVLQTERMRIDSSGNVGIGTSSPFSAFQSTASKLGIETPRASADQTLLSLAHTGTITANDKINIAFDSFSSTATRRTMAQISAMNENPSAGNPGSLLFYTNAGAASLTERLRIDSSGNVGIGTSSAYGSAKLSVAGSVTATGGWTGTNSSAGRLGGVVQSFSCERSGVGTATNVMAFGNGATLGKGLRMPFAGKLIAATLSGTGIDGTVTVDVYLNGSANSSYRLTATNGAPADVGVTQDWGGSPLSFSAGDTIGWYQTTVPSAANVYTVAFFVVYD